MRSITIGAISAVVPDEYVSRYDCLFVVATSPGSAGETFTIEVAGDDTYTYDYTFDSDDSCEVDIRSLLALGSNTITITDSGGVSDSVTVRVNTFAPPLFGMEHPSGLALCQPSDAVAGDQCVWMSRQAASAVIGGVSVAFAAGQYRLLPHSSAWADDDRTYYAHTLQGCEETVKLTAGGGESSRWKIKNNTLNITDITNLDSVSGLPRLSGAEESVTLYKEGLNAYDIGYYSRLLQYDEAWLYKDSAPADAIPCRFSTKKSVIPNGNAGRFTLEIDVIVNVRKPL